MTDGDAEHLEPMRFTAIRQSEVPKGRDGKHKRIITLLLKDIEQLDPGAALKIPLSELPDTKENIRAALSRAASQRHLKIATSSDAHFLYVWKAADGSPATDSTATGIPASRGPIARTKD